MYSRFNVIRNHARFVTPATRIKAKPRAWMSLPEPVAVFNLFRTEPSGKFEWTDCTKQFLPKFTACNTTVITFFTAVDLNAAVVCQMFEYSDQCFNVTLPRRMFETFDTRVMISSPGLVARKTRVVGTLIIIVTPEWNCFQN